MPFRCTGVLPTGRLGLLGLCKMAANEGAIGLMQANGANTQEARSTRSAFE
jgi:hypothetical protein